MATKLGCLARWSWWRTCKGGGAWGPSEAVLGITHGMSGKLVPKTPQECTLAELAGVWHVAGNKLRYPPAAEEVVGDYLTMMSQSEAGSYKIGAPPLCDGADSCAVVGSPQQGLPQGR